MARLPGWQSRMYAAIEAARQKPFAWSEHDCVSWSISVVEQITGVDHYAKFRGQYTNEIGAAKLIKRTGPDLPSVVSMYFQEVPVLLTHHEDLVMINGAVGICDGLHSHFITEQGLTTFKTAACTNAWRVG